MVAFLTRGCSGNPCKCCTTELHIDDSTECTVALIIQTEHVHQEDCETWPAQLLARRFCNLQAVKDSGQRVTGRGGLQRAISGRQVVHDRVLVIVYVRPKLQPPSATSRPTSPNKISQPFPHSTLEPAPPPLVPITKLHLGAASTINGCPSRAQQLRP